EASVTKSRLVVADDHGPMVRVLERRLAREFDVVGTAADGSVALHATARLDPDAIVLDISMPNLDGIEVARRLKAAGSKAKIIMLTVHDDPDFLRAALDAGALGYVLKSRLPADLVPAIRAALTGRIFISPVKGRPDP